MDYATLWIIRFQGRLTQGPNAGKAYTYATSWAGVQFDSLEAAQQQLARYLEREPHMAYQICSRQWQGGRKGRFIETVVQTVDNGPGFPEEQDNWTEG